MHIDWSLLLWVHAGVVPVFYDTRAVTQSCIGSHANEGTIVVCGRHDQDRYRVPKLLSDEPTFGAATTNIAGAKLGVEAAQTRVGGFPSNRVMVRIKIPF